MAYQFQPDGTIVVDTLQDAIDLAVALATRGIRLHISAPSETTKKKGKKGVAVVYAPPPPRPVHDDLRERWNAFMRAINPNMHEVLALVEVHPRGIQIDRLMDKLGISDSTSLSGILSGLSKNIAKHGLKFEDVFIRTPVGYGPDRTVTYRPGPLLRTWGAKMPP